MVGRRAARFRAPKFVVVIAALFLTFTMVAGIVGPSFPWVPWSDDKDGRADTAARLDEARGKAAKQQWGSADGLPSESDSRDGNWGMPVSEQAKYARANRAEQRLNDAKVVEGQDVGHRLQSRYQQGRRGTAAAQ